jgi:hypothetical protein
MKRVAKKKAEPDESGLKAAMRVRFRSFGKLAEQAAGGRPQLRGIRVAQDPVADRFVVVQQNARVEFVLRIQDDAEPPHADVECRRLDSAGAAEEATIAHIRFNEAGVVTQSTVPELVDERIDQPQAAWSFVAAAMWNAMMA